MKSEKVLILSGGSRLASGAGSHYAPSRNAAGDSQWLTQHGALRGTDRFQASRKQLRRDAIGRVKAMDAEAAHVLDIRHVVVEEAHLIEGNARLLLQRRKVR